MQLKMNGRKLLSCAIALWPLLEVYELFAGISFGEALVLVSLLFCIIENPIFHVGNIKYFYLYIFGMSIINALFNIGVIKDGYFQSVFSYVLHAVLLLGSLNYVDLDFLVNIYKKISVIVCALALIQYVLLLGGVSLVEIIPGIPTTVGLTYSELQMNLGRMCGPFTEPAHLIQYLSVALIIALFDKKPNYKYAILLIGTSLLTRSGNSMVLIGAIVGIKILTDLLQKNRKVFFRAFFSTVILIIAFITIYNRSETFRLLLLRVYEITGNSRIEALGYISVSGYFRVKYGLDVFASLHLPNQIFGLGIGVFECISDSFRYIPYSLRLVFNNELLNYRSGFTTILIDGGIIGMLLYLKYLFGNRSKDTKMVAGVLIVMQIISASMNGYMWIIYLLMLEFYDKKAYEKTLGES
jgi:hypothetical protein